MVLAVADVHVTGTGTQQVQVGIRLACALDLRCHAGIAGNDVDVRDRGRVLGEHQVLIAARVNDFAACCDLGRNQRHAIQKG